MNVVQATGLGKRYRSSWALRDCDLAIPKDRVVALVGPNGAGKTTLLHCIVGLARPTTGTVSVMGRLAAGSPRALDAVSFVAQDAPLYQHLNVERMVELSDALNGHFDRPYAIERLDALRIPLDYRVGRLSGGQQAQLALTLALARRPELLILDEPLARLDPLARHEFMATVLAAVAEEGLSVIMSSHVVAELERVADYLVIMTDGQIQMAGEIETLLREHAIWYGPSDARHEVGEQVPVVYADVGSRLSRLIVRAGPSSALPAGWEVEPLTVEELVLAYLREPTARALPPRVLVDVGIPQEEP